MSERVNVIQLGNRDYAAEVQEGGQTTEHRVMFPETLLEALEMPEPDERRFVVETMRYLLERTPSTALPHDIDLDGIDSEDLDFLPEVRSRMAG